MPGALAARLTLALAAVLLLLTLLLALTLEAARTAAERELREGRFVYSLAQLKQRVEVPLSLGLGMDSLAYLQRMLAAEAAADPEILSIDLFDAEGRLLYTTDVTGIRDAVPEGWTQALHALPELTGAEPQGAELQGADADPAAAVWRVGERGGQALGVALVNDFGLTVGGLALRHAVSDIGDEVLREESLSLALLLLALAGGGALAGGLGLWLLCRPVDRQAAALRRALAAETGTQAAVPSPAEAGGPAASAQLLLSSLQRAEQRCQAAAAEIERIDARA